MCNNIQSLNVGPALETHAHVGARVKASSLMSPAISDGTLKKKKKEKNTQKNPNTNLNLRLSFLKLSATFKMLI